MPTILLRDKHIEYILSLQDVRFLATAAARPSQSHPPRGVPLPLAYCILHLWAAGAGMTGGGAAVKQFRALFERVCTTHSLSLLTSVIYL